MSADTRPAINLDDLTFTEQAHGAHFAARHAPVGTLLGATQLGYRVTVVPPGKRAWPYHAHLANEEMFFVLRGQGTLRHAGHDYPLREGDFIAAPADPQAPHQIVNTSEHELCYIAVSTMREPDVCLYPDSDKFGVIAGSAPGGDGRRRTLAVFAEHASGVDYWHGEPGPGGPRG